MFDGVDIKIEEKGADYIKPIGRHYNLTGQLMGEKEARYAQLGTIDSNDVIILRQAILISESLFDFDQSMTQTIAFGFRNEKVLATRLMKGRADWEETPETLEIIQEPTEIHAALDSLKNSCQLQDTIYRNLKRNAPEIKLKTFWGKVKEALVGLGM